MMKKVIALALLAALLLSGCQRAPDAGETYNPATDWPKFTMTSDGVYIGESDLGYYLPTAHFLQFVDKQTMEPTILCAKPNCLHNREPNGEKQELCDACFLSSFWDIPVCYLDGYLYAFTTNKHATYYENAGMVFEQSLIRANPDGTGRTELFRLPKSVSSYKICVHRGVFYYVIEDYSENGEGSAAVFARPLNQKNGESKLLFQVPKNYKVSDTLLAGISAYGNWLYVCESIDSEGHVLHIYNLQTDEHTVMPVPEGLSGVYKVCVFQDKLYIQYVNQDVGESENDRFLSRAVYYKANLDGTNPVLVNDTLTRGLDWTDGKYIYHVTGYKDSDERTVVNQLEVLNEDLEKVCSFDLDAFSEGKRVSTSSLTIMPMHDGRVFIRIMYGGEWAYFWFSHEEIEAGVIQPKEFLRYTRRDFFQNPNSK